DDYSVINPEAKKIHDLFEQRGETVLNDHVAFRTFAHPLVGITALSQIFLKFGYKAVQNYEFKEKKLKATHFVNSDQNLPKIFISELLYKEFSPHFQKIIESLIKQIPADFTKSEDWIVQGRAWDVSFKMFEELEKESDYAGWLSAFGFRANHFTVNFNELKTFSTMQDLNNFLKQSGFSLNASGGEIKGTAQELLEQSSTMAPLIPVSFTNGIFNIPSCYYEFARRYKDNQGNLYQGFIAASADKIFESTHRK
ncbi:MAG: DUF1338 domain-containing protein, partial [Bacteriovoracaceae bacterium]|nr:DUF1338 domain-containing protein [Bacteriovoracaceae bacterium]